MKTSVRTTFALLALALFALPLMTPAAQAVQEPAVSLASAAEANPPAPEPAPEGDAVENLTPEPTPQCIQITVWAQDPETGECHEFPNPCSVPDGWDRYFDPETCTNW